ncbi:unnamed protein product [Musa hybrid cultivar]
MMRAENGKGGEVVGGSCIQQKNCLPFNKQKETFLSFNSTVGGSDGHVLSNKKALSSYSLSLASNTFVKKESNVSFISDHKS